MSRVYTDLGKLIYRQRKKMGMTQKNLGDRLGVSAQAVSEWEIRGKYPDHKILPSLITELQIQPDELMNAFADKLPMESTIDEKTDQTADKSVKSHFESSEHNNIDDLPIIDQALRDCIPDQHMPVHFTKDSCDSIVGELRRKETYLIAGDPGEGKTQLLLNISDNVIRNINGTVYFFSMGTYGKDIIKRLLLIETGKAINIDSYNDPLLTEEDAAQLRSTAEFIRSTNFIVDDSRDKDIHQIHQTCINSPNLIDLIIIDSLELLKQAGERNGLSGSSICNELHELAKDCNCPVLVSYRIPFPSIKELVIERFSKKTIAEKVSTDLWFSYDNVFLLKRQKRSSEQYAKVFLIAGKTQESNPFGIIYQEEENIGKLRAIKRVRVDRKRFPEYYTHEELEKIATKIMMEHPETTFVELKRVKSRRKGQ